MTYIVTDDVVIVNSIWDFPAAAGGVITLESKRYVFNSLITTSNRFVVPASGTCTLDCNKDIGAGIVYTGSDTLFSGTLEAGKAFSLRRGILISAPSGTVFNIDGATDSLLFLAEAILDDCDTCGTLDTIQVILKHSNVLDCGDGFTFNNNSSVGIHGDTVINWKNRANSNRFHITGTLGFLGLINTRFDPKSNEHIFYIEGTFTSGSIVNVGLLSNPSQFYNPSGKDQSYIHLVSQGVQGVPDSTITGRIKVVANASATVIGTAGKYEPINATYIDGITEERINFLSSYGEMEYIGIETEIIHLNGWASIKNSIGVEQDLRIQAIMLSNKTACTFDDSTDYITAVAHGFENDDMLELREDGGLPTNLAENVPYFVINKTDDTFQISLTSGGAAIDFGDDGTGTNYFMGICCGSTSSITAASSAKTRAVSISELIQIETGNIIKFYATNLDAANNVIITDLNINLKK